MRSWTRQWVLLAGLFTSTAGMAIEVHQAAPMRVVPSPSEPKKVQSSEPKTVHASEPGIVQAAEPGSVAAPTRSGEEVQSAGDIPSGLFGRRWHLRVPGAAWQMENRVEGTRTLHVAPGSGTLPHELTISPDGRYLWVAYGKKMTGTWARNVKSGYPLTLQKGYEGKDWHVTIKDGELLLWDGSSLAGQFRGR